MLFHKGEDLLYIVYENIKPNNKSFFYLYQLEN
jgi:hypothetical protein